MKKVLIAFVAFVAIAAGAFWWFVLRDDAPAAVTARPCAAAANASESAAGVYAIQQAPDVFAGYRIQELFGADTLKRGAVGRSPAVTGTMSIEGSTVTAVNVEVDTTKLKSSSSLRDGRIKTLGLETVKFSTASFTLTTPVAVPGSLKPGVATTFDATGDLTLHGVTKPVTIALTACWTGAVVRVDGSTPIVMADYAISPPSIGGIVSVDDHGVLEFQLTFGRS
ncbi:MAG: YceI family protein [Acidimicrobiales bacterium]